MAFKKLNWRTILHIHIYLGLFCTPFLIIFSLSSLDFNHHFMPQKSFQSAKEWERKIMMTKTEDLSVYSDQLLDSLQIFGWFLPWSSYQDSNKTYIEISQPAKRYDISISPQGLVKVVETPESIANVAKLLHFIGEDIPHAPWWVNAWKHYQSLTVYALVFWFLSGIYLWLRKKKSPKVEKILMYGGMVISILFILLIWLKK